MRARENGDQDKPMVHARSTKNSDNIQVTAKKLNAIKNDVDITTDQSIDLNRKVRSLEKNIAELNKKLADKEETIDDLVQERDEDSNEIYKLRLYLAKSWNIRLATDAEKVREVFRRTKSKTVGEDSGAR